MGDLNLINKLSNGKIDLTFGSALDIFGGNGITLSELIQWNHRAEISNGRRGVSTHSSSGSSTAGDHDNDTDGEQEQVQGGERRGSTATVQ